MSAEVLPLEGSVKITLRDAGFLTDRGDYVNGLFDSKKAKEDFEVLLRHGRVLFKEKTEIDLIYEIPSINKDIAKPSCIYFKKIEDINDENKIKQIRTDVWNFGRSPILWIIGPTMARIYDAFARPQEDDTLDSHILRVLRITSEGLEDAKLVRRELFDTGKFWEIGDGKRINSSQKVEKALLDDLWDTERLLTSKEGGIPVPTAHALLGRVIFMAYLWDRGIITLKFLQKMFGCRNIKDLLKDKARLRDFFNWMDSTFNGDLFPINMNTIDAFHLKIVRYFLEGTDMKSIILRNKKIVSPPQRRLWPYNFDIIPIELISSIYEMFAHSKGSIDARAKSIYYTKPHLVDLVLSVAMVNLSENARILDPSCGSGVFLVDAFRRLVLKRSLKLGRTLDHEEILKILSTQIYGVDIEPGAVEVTAFSLYLTLLELDENLKKKKTYKFPKLIYHPNESWEADYMPTLYKQDICNWKHEFNQTEPFKSLKFDLIVGNLPWTKLTKTTAPRDPENIISGRQWSLDYCEKKGIYRNFPDQAIMLRVKDFAKAKTKMSFIISSRIFYQQDKTTKNFWLNSFLKDNSVESIFNLTDLAGSKILFGDKRKERNIKSPSMPASIITYRALPPKDDWCITYISPKWYPKIADRENIIIQLTDIQNISNDILIDNPYLWKIAFRGTQRDFKLIKKISKRYTLKDILQQMGITKKQYSQGYEHGSKYNEKHFRVYFSLPNLEEDIDFKYYLDTRDLPKFDYNNLGRMRRIDVFRGPLLIFRRSLINNETRIAFIPNDTVFSSTFFGISFHNKNEKIAHRINAILNSKLGLYLTFLLGDSFGWHFKLIEQKDWLRIPLPKSILDLEDKRWDRIVEIEKMLSQNWNPYSSSDFKYLENELFNAACDLYEFEKDERIVIEDTIKYSIDYFLNRKDINRLRCIKPPSLKQLENYSVALCGQINCMLAEEKKKLVYQLYELEKSSPLTIVEFKEKKLTTIQENKPKKIEGLKEALSVLAEDMRTRIIDRVYALEHLRVYEGENLYIIKPAEERFWSRSQALNDADEIIKEHMESFYEHLYTEKL